MENSMFQKYLYRCTEKVIEALNLGLVELVNVHQNVFTPDFILLGLLQQKNSQPAKIIDRIAEDNGELRSKIVETIYESRPMSDTQPRTENQPQVVISPETEAVFQTALQEAKKVGDKFIATDICFLSLFSDKAGTIKNILEQVGLTDEKVRAVIQELRGGRTISDKQSESTIQVLEKFTVDLTEQARQHQLDPVIARDDEIMRMIEILSRRKKNNPVLIGPPGVGKTVIVEGLAQRIVTANVPENLLKKRVVMLNMGELIAGAKFKGEFEERVKMVKDEITASAGEIILFIDELHTVLAGGGNDGISAGNMLKPALARGELRCIGATTPEEYKKTIETDKALTRRFQQIQVSEPSVEETIRILQGLRPHYEKHHHIVYDEAAIDAAVKLSEKYITERYLPDKAVDLLDEAGARKHLALVYISPEVRKLENKKNKILTEQAAAFEAKDFAKVANLQVKIININTELEQHRKKEVDGRPETAAMVTRDDIAEIVTRRTGIPVNRMIESESEKLAHMEDNIHKRIIGQNPAVEAIAHALRRNRAGLKDTNRPIGTFLFLGPTGVGKTELAKALAEFLLDNENRIIRLDMSEYSERHTVSRMIGAPPGYVGYGTGGQLTEAVRRNPYSVILLDEIEKAHPDVFNILLQIFDEGHLTDAEGITVSFKNTIIIGTSNIGGRMLAKDIRSIGFGTNEEEHRTYDDNKTIIMSDVKKIFKPEFINRLDDIIIFHPLTHDDMLHIVDLNIKKLADKLKEKNIILKTNTAVKEFLVNASYTPQYGARPLKREIERRIENPLSLMIINNEIQDGDTINAIIKNDTIQLKK